jgi:hypothetical protein
MSKGIGGMRLMEEKMKYLEKNLSQFHLHHKSHTRQGPNPDSTAKGLTTNFLSHATILYT